MNISKPIAGTYPDYYTNYIELVKSEDLLTELFNESILTIELLSSLDEETLQFKYAEGKWNVKEVFQHVIDCERIYCTRILNIARDNSVPQPGFDQNEFIKNSNASMRIIHDMIREFSLVRAASIELLKSLTSEMHERNGVANNYEVSVKTLSYLIAGHEIHHRNVIEEKYIGN